VANKNYNFLNQFPSKDTPRSLQIQALEKIAQTFQKGKKFAIVNLPTGSGKSHIGTSVARSTTLIDEERLSIIKEYGIYKKDKNGSYIYEDIFKTKNSFGAFILTVTKSLQDQYTSLFPDLIPIKGKNNYMCAVDNSATVNFAPCLYSPKLKTECFEKNRCPYYKQRNEALSTIDPILNYKAFFNLPEFLWRREIYICDEASNIEEELVGQYTITLSYAFLEAEEISFKKITTEDSYETYRWIQDIYLQLKNNWIDLKHKISLMGQKYDSSSGIYYKQIQRLGKLTEKVNTLSLALDKWQTCDYLIEHKDKTQVVFVPYDIKPIAQHIFSFADKILMMSATISNPIEFTKSLGISPNDYEFVEIPSTFDPQKSPIYCSTQYNLSYKNMSKDLPKIINIALQICNKHKGEKGIIHTYTNAITEAFKKRTKLDNRFLYRTIGQTNQDILQQHQEREKEDTVLVSPSLDTGISLNDDSGRFQIIIKAPYLPLNSKRIKKLFEKNPKYYVMKMLDTLIQMCGRCTRSKKDYSTTYILDGAATKAILSHKNQLPKHFLDRFM
jgi:ATP-dependent DNA helicase DinG